MAGWFHRTRQNRTTPPVRHIHRVGAVRPRLWMSEREGAVAPLLQDLHIWTDLI